MIEALPGADRSFCVNVPRGMTHSPGIWTVATPLPEPPIVAGFDLAAGKGVTVVSIPVRMLTAGPQHPARSLRPAAPLGSPYAKQYGSVCENAHDLLDEMLDKARAVVPSIAMGIIRDADPERMVLLEALPSAEDPHEGLMTGFIQAQLAHVVRASPPMPSPVTAQGRDEWRAWMERQQQRPMEDVPMTDTPPPKPPIVAGFDLAAGKDVTVVSFWDPDTGEMTHGVLGDPPDSPPDDAQEREFHITAAYRQLIPARPSFNAYLEPPTEIRFFAPPMPAWVRDGVQARLRELIEQQKAAVLQDGFLPTSSTAPVEGEFEPTKDLRKAGGGCTAVIQRIMQRKAAARRASVERYLAAAPATAATFEEVCAAIDAQVGRIMKERFAANGSLASYLAPSEETQPQQSRQSPADQPQGAPGQPDDAQGAISTD